MPTDTELDDLQNQMNKDYSRGLHGFGDLPKKGVTRKFTDDLIPVRLANVIEIYIQYEYLENKVLAQLLNNIELICEEVNDSLVKQFGEFKGPPPQLFINSIVTGQSVRISFLGAEIEFSNSKIEGFAKRIFYPTVIASAIFFGVKNYLDIKKSNIEIEKTGQEIAEAKDPVKDSLIRRGIALDNRQKELDNALKALELEEKLHQKDNQHAIKNAEYIMGTKEIQIYRLEKTNLKP